MIMTISNRETAVIRECFPTSVLLGSIERPVEPQVDRDDRDDNGDDDVDDDVDDDDDGDKNSHGDNQNNALQWLQSIT